MREENCGVCGTPVVVQIYKNTGTCSAKCARLADKQNVKPVSE